MKDHIKDYLDRLEKGICEYMQGPISERSADAVRSMVKCWKKVNELDKMLVEEKGLTYEEAESWNAEMENEDGTTGGHWTVEQTSAVAEKLGITFKHFSAWCFNTAMNMMYSDYSGVAEKYGVGTAEFYADLAKAFLVDKDGGTPKEKIAQYYHCVVK